MNDLNDKISKNLLREIEDLYNKKINDLNIIIKNKEVLINKILNKNNKYKKFNYQENIKI